MRDEEEKLNKENPAQLQRQRNVPLMGQNLTPSQDRIESISDMNESFPSFIQSVCCPSFSFISISFFLSCFELILYITMVCFGIELEASKLFAPTMETLERFGIKDIKSIKSGHVWRWITSAFIHSTLIHLTINIISQIVVGSCIEAILGQWKTGLLFLISAISGGVFSCLISDVNSTSASSILYGMLGAYVVFTLINYYSLDKQIGITNKYCNLLFIVFIIALNISSGFTNGRIDTYANLGSFLFCFFFTMTIISPYEKDQGLLIKDRIYFWVGIAVTCLIIPLMIILFFTVRKVD